MKVRPDVVLIAGPTASGKSKLALDIAETHNGVVINTDSMQVYGGLRVLTARPNDKDLRRSPHKLYGHIAPHLPYSVGHWLKEVAVLLPELRHSGKIPIFVGGTGLYFNAFEGGIAEMPDIPADIRKYWRSKQIEGASTLHTILSERDPEVAVRINPSDMQRIVRALEMLEATGKSIAYWQSQRSTPLINADWQIERHLLLPDRQLLHQRINQRVEWMLENGAIEEVENLAKIQLPDDALARKAIGVRQLLAMLEGLIGRDQATDQIQAATRQYAKRQYTWFRHQLGPDWRHYQ